MKTILIIGIVAMIASIGGFYEAYRLSSGYWIFISCASAFVGLLFLVVYWSWKHEQKHNQANVKI
jgi:hypothetical protein